MKRKLLLQGTLLNLGLKQFLNMLSHLLYVSKKSKKCTPESIDAILISAKKNNPTLDITGVLLHTPTGFIQCLEGDFKTILKLYDDIKLDTRHEQVTLMSLGPIKERSFPNWYMGYKKLNHEEPIFLTPVAYKDIDVINGILSGASQGDQKYLSALLKLVNSVSEN